MKRSLILSTMMMLLVVFGCSKTDTLIVYRDVDPLLDTTATVTVGRVIDGDTFVVGFGNDSISVRILGIDAFEIKHDARLDSQAVKAHISVDSAYTLGQAGKLFADSLLNKQKVIIVRGYKEPNFDSFSRLLRRVYFYQGSQLVDYDSVILKRGFAFVY